MVNRSKLPDGRDGGGGAAKPRAGKRSGELLTTDEVIDRLLEDANLRRVAATCVLPAVRFGSTWRFRRSDLDEWIRKQGFDAVTH